MNFILSIFYSTTYVMGITLHCIYTVISLVGPIIIQWRNTVYLRTKQTKFDQTQVLLVVNDHISIVIKNMIINKNLLSPNCQ